MATAELPEGITQEELDRYARLSSGILALTAEKNELNAKIKAAFEGKSAGTRVYGNTTVKIALTSTFDAKAFETTYPFETNPSYYVAALDAKNLPASLKEPFTTKAPRLSITTLAVD